VFIKVLNPVSVVKHSKINLSSPSSSIIFLKFLQYHQKVHRNSYLTWYNYKASPSTENGKKFNSVCLMLN
jgi:hypothetical protein